MYNRTIVAPLVLWESIICWIFATVMLTVWSCNVDINFPLREREDITSTISLAIFWAGDIIMALGVINMIKNQRILIDEKGVQMIRGKKKKSFLAWDEIHEIGIVQTTGGEKIVYITKKTGAYYRGLALIGYQQPANDLIKIGYSRKLMEVIEKYYHGPILGKKPAKKRQEEGKKEEGKIMERMEGMGKGGYEKSTILSKVLWGGVFSGLTLYIVAIMFYSMAEQRERGILTAAIWVTLGTAMILWMLWLKKRNVIRVNAEGVYVRRGAHKKDIYMAWEEVEEVGISPLGPNQKAIYIARKTEAKEEIQWQGLLFSKDMVRVLYSRDLKEAIGRYYKGPILEKEEMEA